MKLYCNNKVVINLSNNPVLYDQTKHVEIDHYFIREKIDSKQLVLPYIRFEYQVADMFTKGFLCRNFEMNVSKLSMSDIYAKLEGEC